MPGTNEENKKKVELVSLNECRITRVISYENGLACLKMECGESKILAVGQTCSINPGAFYHLCGHWRETKRGRVFMFQDFSTIPPNNKKMAVEFLCCKGFCRGVRRKTIEKIVNALGDNAITLIKDNPDILDTVSGVGEKTKSKISKAIRDAEQAEKVFRSLYRFGINARDAFTLYCKYREDTLPTIGTDPYKVAEENNNIYSFGVADNIAHHYGLDATAPFRIRAGILEALRNSTEGEGHSYLSVSETVRRTVQLLFNLRPDEADMETLSKCVREAIPLLVDELTIVKEVYDNTDCLYLPSYATAENVVAEKLSEISRTPLVFENMDTIETYSKYSFSDEQKEAIDGALHSPFCIITGGPGSGKSLIMSEIVKKHLLAGHCVKLAAPTAKAADRMEELTGITATTIQRLLGYRPFKGFLYDEENPLMADVVIIDEFSMVDILLMKSLVQAICPGTSFIAIGDADQLPSVGAGNVFADLIKSGVFPVYRLTKIYRQDAGGTIAENAQRINTGKAPHASKDFIFKWCDGSEIPGVLDDIVFNKIPNYAFIKSEDIKIITPLREGDRGSLEYSKFLREGFNPEKREDQPSFVGYRVGDKIMQIRNNYEKGVMNGDEGIVESLSVEDNKLTVRFKNNDLVCYTRSEALDEIEFSYVITVHKSQGSEYPAVVIVLPPESGAMMNRRLLYTAVTRAKKMVVIIGSKEAANLSISKFTEIRRNSNLAKKIQETQRSAEKVS